jgi:hypothetical protein
MCTCLHLAKLGVTRTTSIQAQTFQSASDVGYRNPASRPYKPGPTLCVAMSLVGWLQPLLEVDLEGDSQGGHSFAGRATGSGSSKVGGVTGAPRHPVPPPRRQARDQRRE